MKRREIDRVLLGGKDADVLDKMSEWFKRLRKAYVECELCKKNSSQQPI